MSAKFTVAAKLAMLVGVLVLSTLVVGAAAIHAVRKAQGANLMSLQVQRDLKDTVSSARTA